MESSSWFSISVDFLLAKDIRTCSLYVIPTLQTSIMIGLLIIPFLTKKGKPKSQMLFPSLKRTTVEDQVCIYRLSDLKIIYPVLYFRNTYAVRKTVGNIPVLEISWQPHIHWATGLSKHNQIFPLPLLLVTAVASNLVMEKVG